MTHRPLQEAFQRAVEALESCGVPFMVYGGLALPAWGDVIKTEDIDFVVRVDEAEAQRMVAALVDKQFALPENAADLFFIDKWIVAKWGGRDVDLALGITPFDEEAIRRAVRVRLFDREVPIASAEDLILYKLAAFRRKDLAHVEDIVVRQGEKLDLPYLKRWADEIARATGKFEIPSTLEQILAENHLGGPV